jgi:uncharacterized protein (TIRG00374 family)
MNLRRFFLFAGLVGLVVVAILGLGRLDQFLAVLRGANWYVLGLIVLIQLVSYFFNAKYYQSFLRIFTFRRPFRELYRTAITLNYVNQVFPSAGVSGASYLSHQLKGVPVGKATLTQLFRYLFTYLSFLAVLTLGFLFLFFARSSDDLGGRLMLLFVLLIVVLGVVVIALLDNRSLVERIGWRLVEAFNWIARFFTRKKRQVDRSQAKRFFDELYQGFETLLAKRGAWGGPLLYAFLGSLAEIATVYIVFLAFGSAPNPGTVIVGYALANMAGLFSFATLGLGAYEGAMIAAFTALGVPFTLAFAVTIVYRVLNMWLFMPVGFYFYRRSL